MDNGLVIKRLLEGETWKEHERKQPVFSTPLKEPAEKCVEVPQIPGARNNIAQPTEKQGVGCGGGKNAHIHMLHSSDPAAAERGLLWSMSLTLGNRRLTAGCECDSLSVCGFHDKLQNVISFLFFLLISSNRECYY